VSRGLDVLLVSMREGETASAHVSSSYAGAAYPCELRVTLDRVHRHQILAEGGVVRTRVAGDAVDEQRAAGVTETVAAFIKQRSLVELRLAEQPGGWSGEAVQCDHRLSFTVRHLSCSRHVRDVYAVQGQGLTRPTSAAPSVRFANRWSFQRRARRWAVRSHRRAVCPAVRFRLPACPWA
jgi:hypothetical protein